MPDGSLRSPFASLLAGSVVVLAACGGGGQPSALSPSPMPDTPSPGANILPPSLATFAPTNLPACTYPKKLPPPSWLPADLALPPGSYLSQALTDANGYHRALFVAPVPLADLVRFVVKEWPAKGWQLGRGDSEANEAEDEFMRGSAAGAFKATGTYCNPGYSNVLILYSPTGNLSPSPAG